MSTPPYRPGLCRTCFCRTCSTRDIRGTLCSSASSVVCILSYEVIPSSSNEGLSWPEPVARHDDPPSGRGRGSGPGPAAKRGRFGGIELPRFPQKERFLCSPELAHLVAFCNEAARRDRGNVLWLSWNSNGAVSKKAEEDKLPIRGIDFGSTLLAFTVDAARAVLDEARTAAPGHWDLWLLQVLCRATSAAAAPWPSRPSGTTGSGTAA